jgi:hypothetical protein
MDIEASDIYKIANNLFGNSEIWNGPREIDIHCNKYTYFRNLIMILNCPLCMNILMPEVGI